MQDLILQEQFEIEVLELLNTRRLLTPLVFCGGTALRLCHGLNRYSVDLDFWVVRDLDFNAYFQQLETVFAQQYGFKDKANKFFSLLFSITSPRYPRYLKIEIRKEQKAVKIEQQIAYSRYSSGQVLLNTLSLDTMMAAKVAAFLDRHEIRDAFDLEFLVKKGISLPISEEQARQLLKKLHQLKHTDFSVKLGSLLDKEQRGYYVKQRFAVLEQAALEKLG